MISVHLSRRALRRTLAVISAGVVVFGALGAVPSATAGPQASDGKVVTKQQPARALGAGRYVVVLARPRRHAIRRRRRRPPGHRRHQAGKPFDARAEQASPDYQALPRRSSQDEHRWPASGPQVR